MDAIVEIVKEWGYWAVFLGSLVEGESVILSASAMASQGYLDIIKVTFIAFIGTTIADQVLYMIGWHYGRHIFDRFPKMKPQVDRAFRLLRKYDMWFIIACRFIYGIRVASAVVIGAAKIPPRRFIPLNILSAAIWAVVSCGAGYYLGGMVIDMFEKSDHVQKTFFMIVGGVIFTGLVLYKLVHFIKNKNKS